MFGNRGTKAVTRLLTERLEPGEQIRMVWPTRGHDAAGRLMYIAFTDRRFTLAYENQIAALEPLANLVGLRTGGGHVRLGFDEDNGALSITTVLLGGGTGTITAFMLQLAGAYQAATGKKFGDGQFVNNPAVPDFVRA